MSTSDKHEAKKILEKINLLFSIFEKDGIENISEIEKSLLLEQIENLSVIVANLKKPISIGTVKRTIEDKIEEINQNSADIAEEIVEEKVIDLVEEQKDVVVVPIVEFVEKVEEPILSEKKVKKTVIEEVKAIEEIKTEISEPSIIVEEKVSETVISTQKKTYNFPLRNMREIIDLNKSFVFKADLFKDNHEAYSKFVDELNKTEDENDALALVEKYASDNNWDKEDNLYAVLVRSVEKRFLPIIG